RHAKKEDIRYGFLTPEQEEEIQARWERLISQPAAKPCARDDIIGESITKLVKERAEKLIEERSLPDMNATIDFVGVSYGLLYSDWEKGGRTVEGLKDLLDKLGCPEERKEQLLNTCRESVRVRTEAENPIIKE